MVDADRQRWDEKYRGRTSARAEATEALRSLESWIPASGRVLDVAGGDGAQAVWLALRGLDVTLCDISGVALQRAVTLAESMGTALTTRRIDLEHDRVPPGPWSFVLCTNYLQRSLWSSVARELSPNGVAVWVHPTMKNLERHEKPSRRFLLDVGEGRRVFRGAGLAIAFEDEGWVAGRHVVRLVGRTEHGRG